MINDLCIEEYILESSAEVEETVSKICKLEYTNLLIHVSSFIHNTVLVQKLKQELNKRITHAKVVLLKHNDKFKSNVEVYAYNSDPVEDDLESRVLNYLYKEKVKSKLRRVYDVVE